MQQELAVQSNNVLVELIAQTGLRNEKAEVLISSYSELSSDIESWKLKNESLQIASIDDKASIEMAKVAYKHIKSIRIDIEKTRKRLKEDSKKEGEAIDSIAKVLSSLVSPLEISLSEKAKYVELHEAKQKAERLVSRLQLVSDLGFAVSPTLIENMSDDMFSTYLEGLTAQENRRKEEEAKAKAEEESRLKAEAEAEAKAEEERKAEQERIRQENERLKAEKLEAERLQTIKDAEAKAEAERLQAIRDAEVKKAEEARKQAEEKAEAERKEAKRIQAAKDAEIAQMKVEAEAKAEAERKQAKAKAEALRKQLEAPEREQLLKALKEAAYTIDSVSCKLFLDVKSSAIYALEEAIERLND